MVLGVPRGSPVNERQKLTTWQFELLQCLTMRSITTEWILSVDLNEKGFSLSSLCRNCIHIRISFQLVVGVNLTSLQYFRTVWMSCL
jgi:hypothetical protein